MNTPKVPIEAVEKSSGHVVPEQLAQLKRLVVVADVDAEADFRAAIAPADGQPE